MSEKSKEPVHTQWGMEQDCSTDYERRKPTCPRCGGTGMVEVVDQDGEGFDPCPDCKDRTC